MDALVVAFIVPNFILNLFSGPVLNLFLPEFSREMVHSQKVRANGFLNKTVTLSALTLLILFPLVCVVGDAVIFAQWDTEKARWISSFLKTLYVAFIFSCLSQIFRGVLNSQRRHLSANLTLILPIALSLGLFILFFERTIGSYVNAILIGNTVELLVLVSLVVKLDFKVSFDFRFSSEHSRRLSFNFVWLVLGSIVMYLALACTQVLAAGLQEGSVAALNYGAKPISFFIGTLGILVNSIIFPRFSDLASLQRWGELKKSLVQFVVGLALLTLPAVFVLAFFAEPLTRLIFERGAFTGSDTVRVAEVQRWLSLQLPFYFTWVIARALLAAVNEVKAIFYLSFVGLILTGVLSVALVDLWQLKGLCLAASLVQGIGGALTFLWALRVIQRRESHV